MDEIQALLEKLFADKPMSERCRLHSEIAVRLRQVSGIPHAVASVQWVPMEKVVANDYNPNKVANVEMRLLRTSILADSYTQPTVVSWDEQQKKYVIIDGFHRYSIMRLCPDIAALTDNHLPVVVLEKSRADRMAATVRHNRARGTHSTQGMSGMVFGMLQDGKTDAQICQELGMEAEELVRLKHITGYARLYKDVKYNRAWAFNTPVAKSAVAENMKEFEKDIAEDGGFEQDDNS